MTLLLVSMSSPAHQASTLPPTVLPMSDIQASTTPVMFPTFMFTVSPKLQKCAHSPNSAPNDQCGKRAQAGTKREPTSAVGTAFHLSNPSLTMQSSLKTRNSKTTLAASHSSDHPNPKPTQPPLQSSQGWHWSQWWGGCRGPMKQRGSWQRLCHGCQWGQSWQGCWGVWLRQWLMGEHQWLWSRVSNWVLPQVLRHGGGKSHVCPQVLQKSVGLCSPTKPGTLKGHPLGADRQQLQSRSGKQLQSHQNRVGSCSWKGP